MTNCELVLLTPVGRGAVSTILVEGSDAAACVGEFCQPASRVPPWQMPLGQVFFGRWQTPEGAAEEIVICRRSADVFEIHCHGGKAAAAAIAASLAARGCCQLDWKSWLHRTGDDLIRIEARIALADALTERTARILLDQYSGSLRRAVKRIVREVHQSRFDSASGLLDQLLQRSNLGLHLTKPWQVALSGPANVGKSSLINRLVGYPRAIVYDAPGTTRDVVTAITAINGWPVELADTAGLRIPQSVVESEGVARARQHLGHVDLVVLVFDLSQPWCEADSCLVTSFPGALVVHNKSDLDRVPSSARPPGLLTSARTGEGIPSLLDELAARLVDVDQQVGQPVAFTQRQIELLCKARRAAGSGQAEIAIQQLREL